MLPAPNWEQKHLNIKAKKSDSSRASEPKVHRQEKIFKKTNQWRGSKMATRGRKQIASVP
jgi:hypothetical protein